MRYSHLRLAIAAVTVSVLPIVTACVNVASLDCNEIATEAKQISQGQALKIQTLANVHETSRNQNEARCEGNAVMSDGSSGTLYLRAYAENGNTMVAYQGNPFP